MGRKISLPYGVPHSIQVYHQTLFEEGKMQGGRRKQAIFLSGPFLSALNSVQPCLPWFFTQNVKKKAFQINMWANSQSYIILNINLFCYLFDNNVRKIVRIIMLNIWRLCRHFYISMQYGMLLFQSLPRYIIFFIAKYFSSLFSYCKYFR